VKAFLLAAGCGTRLRPLTDTLPKCLVLIAGKPLLLHWFQALADAGVSDVLVNTHYLASLVEAVAESWRGPLRVTLSHEPELLGSGGTLVANRQFVAGQHDFLIVYADNLTNAPLRPLWDAHQQSGAVLTTYVYETSKPREKGICVLEPASDRIVGFEEKPLQPSSNIANAGIAVARHDIFDSMPATPPIDLSRDVMPALVGRMQAVRTTAYIRDIGSLADYEAARAEWAW
jgi:mannose-1-phosphate guanylyltransferase